MMKSMMFAFAALAAFQAAAITATKEYVDRRDTEIRTNTYTKDETEAAIAAKPHITTNDVQAIVTNMTSIWRSPLGEFLYVNITGSWMGHLTNSIGNSFKCELEYSSYYGGWVLTDDASGLDLLYGAVSHMPAEAKIITFDLSNYTTAVEMLGVTSLTFTRKGLLTDYITKEELDAAIESIPEVDTSDLASKEDVTAVSNQIPPIVNSVNTMWATMYGENVWLAVTNYMRQVAGTVPSLRLWEVRDNNTNLVYSSQEEIEHVVTQKVHTVETNLTAKMTRKAWGSYQSSGEDNPSSNDVTVVNSQKVMLTGGGTWYKAIETSGACVWVLKSQGVTTFGGDTNGFFRITDLEGNAQLEVVKTADQEVDAVASDTDFDASNNFTVTYNASGSNHPLVSCALDLNDDFDEENGNGEINSLGITVTWAKNGDNLWVATIHQDTRAERLFVHAKMTVQGVNLIRNTAPATFDGGIYINNVRYRLVPYSSGGKTYLTLEAW